jgi:hypothetical protein
MVSVPTFGKLWAGWFHTIRHIGHRQLSVESAARDSPAICKQSARLLLQSSELRLPHPLT